MPGICIENAGTFSKYKRLDERGFSSLVSEWRSV